MKAKSERTDEEERIKQKAKRWIDNNAGLSAMLGDSKEDIIKQMKKDIDNHDNGDDYEYYDNLFEEDKNPIQLAEKIIEELEWKIENLEK